MSALPSRIAGDRLADRLGVANGRAVDALADLLTQLGTPSSLPNVAVACCTLAWIIKRSPWLATVSQPLQLALPALRLIESAELSRLGDRIADPQHGYRTDAPAYSAFVRTDLVSIGPLELSLLTGFLWSVLDDPEATSKTLAASHWASLARLSADRHRLEAMSRRAGGGDNNRSVLELVAWVRRIAGASEVPGTSIAATNALYALAKCLTERLRNDRRRRRKSTTGSIRSQSRADEDRDDSSEWDVETTDAVEPKTREAIDGITGAVDDETVERSVVVSADRVAPTESAKHPSTDKALAERRYHDWLGQRLCAYHWNLLAPEEVVSMSRWLLSRTDARIDEGAVEDAEAAIGVLLMLATGLPATVIVDLPLLDAQSWDTVAANPNAYGIHREAGAWFHPVPRWNRFYGAADALAGTTPVGTVVELPLPFELMDRWRLLNARIPEPRKSLFHTQSPELISSIGGLFEELRTEVSFRITEGRVGRALLAAAYAATRDLPLSMLVSDVVIPGSYAGLHYACVTPSAARDAYTKATRRMFGKATCTSAADYRPRLSVDSLGAFLQIPDSAVRSLATGLYARILAARRLPDGIDAVRAELDATTAYVAAAFIACTGHRPTNALGRLRTGDLDPGAGIALLNDKIVNVGLRHRIVALCPTVSSLLKGHVATLHRLADAARQLGAIRLARTLDDAAKGRKPIFVTSDGRDAVGALTMDWLRSRLPESWRFPLYGLRHRLARRMREIGLAPEFASIQLGHIEFGAQPFGATGTDTAKNFAETTAKAIDSAVIADAWKALPQAKTDAVWPSDRLSRLRHSPAMTEAKVERLERDQLRRRNTERRRRDVARTGLVEQHVDTALALASASSSASGDTPTPVSDRDLIDMEGMLAELAGNDAETLESCRQELTRRLAQLRASGVPAPLPARRFAFAPEPSPFLDGMLHAYAQSRLWRNWLLENALVDPATPAGTADMMLGRVLAGAILFGSVLSRQRLVEHCAALPTARLSCDRGAPTLLLSLDRANPTGAPRTCFDLLSPLVSLLAAPLQTLLRSGEKLPTIEQAEAALLESVPRQYRPLGKCRLFDALIALARIAARFEQPGCIRAIDSGVIAATPLQPHDALLLINGRPGILSENAVSPTADSRSISAIRPAVPNAARGTLSQARAAYAKLRDAVNIRTGKPVVVMTPGGGCRETLDRPAIRRHVASVLDTLRDPLAARAGIVSALADWAHHLVTVRRPSRKFLRLGTAYRYLTRIGRSLVDLAHDLPFGDIDECSLIELYSAALETKPARHRANAAQRILEFHSFLVEAWSLPRIDTSELLASAQMHHHEADASFVGDTQVTAALDLLSRDVVDLQTGTDTSRQSSIRLAEGRRVFLVLLSATGGRPAEIHGMRIGDLTRADSGFLAVIRPSRWRQLKTSASARLIPLDGMTPTECSWIESWIAAERSRLGPDAGPGSPLFGAEASRDRLIERHRLTDRVVEALRCATGRGVAHLYWLRHARATGMVAGAVLGVRSGPEAPSSLVAKNRGVEIGATTTLRQISILMGHSQVWVTLCHYTHGHPLLRSWLGSSDDRLPDTKAAVLLAVSETYLRKIRSRRRLDAADWPAIARYLVDSGKILLEPPQFAPDGQLDWGPLSGKDAGFDLVTLGGTLRRLALGMSPEQVIEGARLSWGQLHALIHAIAQGDLIWKRRPISSPRLHQLASQLGVELPFDWLPSEQVLDQRASTWDQALCALEGLQTSDPNSASSNLQGLDLLLSRHGDRPKVALSREADIRQVIIALERIGVPRNLVTLDCTIDPADKRMTLATLAARVGLPTMRCHVSQRSSKPGAPSGRRRYLVSWTSGVAEPRGTYGQGRVQSLVMTIVRIHEDLVGMLR